MQMNEARRRQREWGERRCAHPSVEREYYFASPTGDDVCSVCGKVVEPDEMETRSS